MREIKFRGKRKDNNEWAYGYFFQTIKESYIIDKSDIFILKQQVWDGFYKVDPETVGQFTGLSDKNGKKIYEGDICKLDGIYSSDDYEIRWGNTSFEAHSEKQPLTEQLIYLNEKDIEVIGNIYENPELLKE